MVNRSVLSPQHAPFYSGHVIPQKALLSHVSSNDRGMSAPKRVSRLAPGKVLRVLSCITGSIIAVAMLMLLLSLKGAGEAGFISALHRQAGVRKQRPIPGTVALPAGLPRVAVDSEPITHASSDVLSEKIRDVWAVSSEIPAPPSHEVLAPPSQGALAPPSHEVLAPTPRDTPKVASTDDSNVILPTSDAPLDPARASLKEILNHRRLRPFRHNPRLTRGNHKLDFEPDMTLLDQGEDADAGLDFSLPITGVVPADSDSVNARVAHEKSAALAIVVVTSPRFMATSRDSNIPRYFRYKESCQANGLYNSDPNSHPDCTAPDRSTSSAGECIATLAEQCDADARCVAFSPQGSFYEHVDVPSCGQVIASERIYSGAPLSGLYLKAPLSVVPVPRKLYSNYTGHVTPPIADASLPDWWTVSSMDVLGHDLEQVTQAQLSTGVFGVQAVMARCAGKARCASFNFPGGWLKDSAHPADMTFMPNSDVYSRSELPPQDYLTTTVMSLLDEIGGGTCGNETSIFAGRVHLYVMDTSARSLHEKQGVSPPALIAEERGPERSDYWFGAFAWLRRRYGTLPCVTFVPSTSYTRIFEAAVPPLRGTPHYHPDNQRKTMPRGLVQQTLDFVSAFRYAAAASPAAHLLAWEDDCFACHGSLSALSSAVAVISSFDPAWGSVKMGNGGSGMLFHSDIVGHLLEYLQTRRGSENIDVSMWRYLNSGAYSDYISRGTWSAHRGLQSSLRLGAGSVWGRVKCNGELDRHWGWYKDCDVQRMAAGSAVEAFAQDWLCSVYSPATDGIVV